MKRIIVVLFVAVLMAKVQKRIIQVPLPNPEADNILWGT